MIFALQNSSGKKSLLKAFFLIFGRCNATNVAVVGGGLGAHPSGLAHKHAWAPEAAREYRGVGIPRVLPCFHVVSRNYR